MANQNTPFQLFKPTNQSGEEMYLGNGAQGLDNMEEGYKIKWTTRQENKGRLYKKSKVTFRTAGYISKSDISKSATIKQKGQPIFSEVSINSSSKSGNILNSKVSPNCDIFLICLQGDTPLNDDYTLDITNITNAQWLEISVDYNPDDVYQNGEKELTQASLGDANDTIFDGGNRAEFLNKIRESLYYEFSLPGLFKTCDGYQSNDTDTTQRFQMYYQFDDDAPSASFTDFMGIGTEEDFNNYIQVRIQHGEDSLTGADYTQIKIGELSSTDLKLVGDSAPNKNYQEYYMDTKTQGETNTFNCKVSFNSNPTYINGISQYVHYFNSFADSQNGDYYLGNDNAFIFHIKIKPRGFARKWRNNETSYNNYYQWNYAPYDIKVVIMVAEPIPYLEFNNTDSLDDDFVLLKAQEADTGTLYVNSNMNWNIEEQETPTNYDVDYSDADGEVNLYTEANNQ